MTTATLGMSFQSASDRVGALQAPFDFKSDRGNTSVDILYRRFLRWRKGLTATTGPPDDASHFGFTRTEDMGTTISQRLIALLALPLDRW